MQINGFSHSCTKLSMLQPLSKTFSLGQQQQHCHRNYVRQSQRKKLTNLPANFGINLLLLFNETSKSEKGSHTPESSYFLYQFRNIPASMIVTAVSLELIWRRRYKNWWLFFSMPFQWEKMYGWAKKGYAFLVDRIGIQFGLMSLTIKASWIDGSIEDELIDKSLPKIIGLLNNGSITSNKNLNWIFLDGVVAITNGIFSGVH